MRILLFLAAIILLFSCNNNLTSIGQDLMENDNYVDMKEYNITDIATVKLDSFITSSGYTTDNSLILKELVMGKYSDDFSGTTTAIPCFQIVPGYRPVLGENLTLDSVTLNFTYGGQIWGDTLNPTLQTFYLYRLDELPNVDNADDNYLLYNTYPLPPHTDILSELSLYPLRDYINHSYFKLNTPKGEEWANKLFESMMYNGEIYQDLPWSFLNEFKGLAIIPGDNNNCLLNIRAMPDSLYLRFHYRKATQEATIDIPFGQREFMYNSIHTENPTAFQDLTDQKQSVSFEEAGISVVQGLTGYMIKMTLPRLPIPPQYTTISKAEIEMTPEIFLNPSVAMPSAISVFASNESNEIISPLYNNTSSGTRVTGYFTPNASSNLKSKYIFDVTDYYIRLLNSSQDDIVDRQILMRLPNWTTSFNRAIITEIPKLKVYYAHYNQD